MLFFDGSQAVTEELIIVYRLDIRAPFSPIDTGPLEPRPIPLESMRQCVLCSLETTTLTGLFITAKLFADVAVFKCRATQSPVLVCHVCCDYRAAH